MGDDLQRFEAGAYSGTRASGVTVSGIGDYSFGYIVPTEVWTHVGLRRHATNTMLYANGCTRARWVEHFAARSYLGAVWSAVPQRVRRLYEGNAR